MGYIVNLNVILDRIFRTASLSGRSNAIENIAQEIMDDHVGFGHRNSIHQNIRGFVAETFLIKFNTKKDLVLEKIVDLIRQYCGRP